MAVQKKNKLHRRFKPKLGTIIIVLALLIFLGTLFGTNAMQIYRLQQQKSEITSQIDAENNKSEQLDEDIKQIGTKYYIEEVARKYLKLFYPSEKIVVPVEGQDNTEKKQESNQNQTGTGESKNKDNAGSPVQSEGN